MTKIFNKKEFELLSIRFLFLIFSISIFLFGLIINLINFSKYDPFILRVILSGLFFLLFIISFYPKISSNNLLKLLNLLYFFTNIWVLYLNCKNNFSTIYTNLLLFTLIICLLTSLKYIYTLILSICYTPFLIVSVIFCKDIEYNKFLFLLIITVSIIFCFFIVYYINFLEKKKSDYEEYLVNQLQIKDTYLKEIHHRIKNNLNIIESLISIELTSIKDQNSINFFQDIKKRIITISKIHENMYKTKDFLKINYGDYINDLISEIKTIHNRKINFNVNIENIYLKDKIALNISLIINELLTNSIKHSIEEKELNIFIQITKINNNLKIVISDNGKGFPEEILKNNINSFGMNIVFMLVKQLNGEIILKNINGAYSEIYIPIIEDNV